MSSCLNTNKNPYKYHKLTPVQESNRKFWGSIFVISVVTAVVLLGKALTFHPGVARGINYMNEAAELTNLMDKRSSPCKIAIVSYCHGHRCPDFWEKAKLNHAAYAELHGYDYIAESDAIVDLVRDPQWSIFKVIAKWLPHYDWVYFVDPSGIFMNGDYRIEEVFNLNDPNSGDIHMSWDNEGPHGDTMIVKGTAKMLTTMQQLFNQFGKKQFFPDVGGAVDMYVKNRGLNVQWHTFRKFQSMGDEHAYESPVWKAQMSYQEGDWMVRDGSCGFSLARCYHSGVFHKYWEKLENGMPKVTTQPPAKKITCSSAAIDVQSYHRAALSLLRREYTPSFLLNKATIGGNVIKSNDDTPIDTTKQENEDAN